MRTGDAFGQLLRDFHDGKAAYELVERDDGLLMVGAGAGWYFAPVRRWPAVERRALRFVRGRVLDVGCGPGRVALELQARGLDVVGIDSSEGAVEVARARGVREAQVLGLDALRADGDRGRFDTVVMYGNNFGVLGSTAAARRLLRRLATLTTERGRIVAGTLDPYASDDPVHRAYYERNRRRGRLSCQVRLRVRHRDLCTPWFDWLFVSREEMAELAEAGGWRLVRTVDGDGAQYVGVLEKA